MSTDSIYGQRFRTLMPRPFTGCSTNSSTYSTTPTHCCSLYNPNIRPWNQPLRGMRGYEAKTDSRGLPMVSSRWNPTPEQLQALEEMYRRGTRTPSAEKIQHIAAKLRRFGKIEGKNVFYWFQNHKAREKQKKRRQLELLARKDNQDTEIQHRRQSGLNRQYLEIEQPKKLPTMSNCSTASKYSESMHGAVVQECKRDGWTQLDRKEVQRQIITAKSTQTCCRPLDLSIEKTIHKITDQKAPGQENSYPFVALNSCELLNPKNDSSKNSGSEIKKNKTLQLFPDRSNDLSTISATKEDTHDVSSIGTKLIPNQFFEFLPTKN